VDTSSGQPVGAIWQIAFTVPDLMSAIPVFADRLHAGPWMLMEHFRPPTQQYRGKPTDQDVSLAVAFTGSLMVELIEQHDLGPSVYRETVDRQGHGFHHFAVTTTDFDTAEATYRATGYEAAYTARTGPAFGSARVAYFDSTADLPGMIELVELTPAVDAFFGSIKALSEGWDGTDLIRRP
jgi:hypothetical protein